MNRKTRTTQRASRGAAHPAAGGRALLVDIGNTRIKWAVWSGGRLGRMQAGEHAGWSSSDYAKRVLNSIGPQLERIVVSSVAGDEVTRRFAAAARQKTGVSAELIATSRRAAGVETRYSEPWRLGVDRFLGVIAAHRLAGQRAACVVNVGTAVTVDFIDPFGVHHGGAILPGPRLMVDALLRRTAGIAHRARRTPTSSARRPRQARAPRSRPSVSLFARNTAAAIDQGAWHAVAATVEHAFGEGFGRFGAEPLVILTGGGASQLRPLVSVPHVEIPDLVLAGIALHAGLELR